MQLFNCYKQCIFIVSIGLVTSCNEPSFVPLSNDKPDVGAMKNPEVIKIQSLDELMALFKKHQYTNESWAQGNREVPRLSFDNVSTRWHQTANKIPVKLKKEVFFRLMAPLVLISNEQILLERSIIENSHLTDVKLMAIAMKYGVLDNAKKSVASNEKHSLMTEKLRNKLLTQVDIMPASLALAQAAEESGWGTSRFTEEGNAFFGQWDFSGKGMVPKQQRQELGNYGLARFDTPLDSVKGYMFNINTTKAYQALRNLRAKLRSNGQPITGIALAPTLDKYSERGQDYIDGIIQMIRYNKLEDIDEAYLSDETLIHLISEN